MKRVQRGRVQAGDGGRHAGGGQGLQGGAQAARPDRDPADDRGLEELGARQRVDGRPVGGNGGGRVGLELHVRQWARRLPQRERVGLELHVRQWARRLPQNTHEPMVASEHCSCQSDRTAFANASDRILGAEASWSCIKNCWEPVAARSFVQGLFDWTGFDCVSTFDLI